MTLGIAAMRSTSDGDERGIPLMLAGAYSLMNRAVRNARAMGKAIDERHQRSHLDGAEKR